jgi:hypothetical protein
MTRWQRNLLDVLYIAMESIPWFAAITVLATIGERGYLTELSRALRSRIAADFLENPERARAVAESLAERAESATAGPALWAVALTAFGGFWLMRAMIQIKLTGPAGAGALVLASVFGLNILLHITFAEDLVIWRNGGLATFIDDPQAFVASGADFQAVVNRGGVVIGSATAIGVTAVGMVAIWIRFMAAARRPIRFDQVLRSFGIGFAVILGALLVARVNDVSQIAIYAIPYFVLGLLALSVANGERAALPAEGSQRIGSWSVSVTATISLLIVVAAVFGLAAALDVGSALSYLGGAVGTLVEWLLIIILTPIFWVLVPLLEFLIPDGLAQRLQALEIPDNFVEPEVLEDGQQEDDFIFPRWPFDLLKLLVFVGLVWVAYRVGRSLLMRREDGLADEFDEFRSETGGGPGLGGLLRGLLRRRPSSEASAWLQLEPIYGVYGRSVVDAEDRGFERRRSETPLEYSAASGVVLEAPVFTEIADAFDAARYGGHPVDPELIRRWSAELEQWERANPGDEDLREYLEQIRPPSAPREIDAAEEFARRVKRGREAFKQMRTGEGMDSSAGRSPL